MRSAARICAPARQPLSAWRPDVATVSPMVLTLRQWLLWLWALHVLGLGRCAHLHTDALSLVPNISIRHQWARYRRRLANVTVAGQQLDTGLIQQHTFALTRTQLERGLAFAGSLGPLGQLTQSLAAKDTQRNTNITVGGLLGPLSCRKGIV